MRGAGVALLNYVMCVALDKRVLFRTGATNLASQLLSRVFFISCAGKGGCVHALPCCAWALNIALLLLCNIYDGFIYIPFASWAGAAGARVSSLSCRSPTRHWQALRSTPSSATARAFSRANNPFPL